MEFGKICKSKWKRWNLASKFITNSEISKTGGSWSKLERIDTYALLLLQMIVVHLDGKCTSSHILHKSNDLGSFVYIDILSSSQVRCTYFKCGRNESHFVVVFFNLLLYFIVSASLGWWIVSSGVGGIPFITIIYIWWYI